MSSPRDLPVNRLATTDATGRRVWLYPSEVRGRFRNARTIVFWALIAVFFILPWARVGGHPAILLDIPGRRFAVFGLTLWAHDAPILLFLFLGAALSLAFVTAVYGRLWCGWACPQTVFIDAVFRRIEAWLEGDSIERRRLDEAPWSFKKGLAKGAKWAAFTVISLLISHTFVAYFTGSDQILKMVMRPPAENPITFIVVMVTAGFLLFDFGWFREQFCTIACPYGRFQSVLMDGRSLAVLYDPIRGEPRKGTPAVATFGDCVNCYRCVQVCPTGIDIRRGVQMECIACTACIDACDDVMTRLGKPRGLIRYDSELGIKTVKAPDVRRQSSFQVGTRGWVYFGILLLIAAGLVSSIAKRLPLEFTVTRAAEAPYSFAGSTDRGAQIINHFKIDFSNQSFEGAKIEVALPSSGGGRAVELIMPMSPLALPAGQSKRADFFLKFPDSILSYGHGSVMITVTSSFSGRLGKTVSHKEVHLVGPLK